MQPRIVNLNSEKLSYQTRFVIGSFHTAAPALFLQIPKLCTDLDPILLDILMYETNGRLVLKNKMLALGNCLPQPCSNSGRMFAASRSRLHYYRRMVSFPQQRIR